MDTSLREPAVAGSFYPGTATALDRQIHDLIPDESEHHQLLGCISPHAGYVYSGGVAGKMFGHLEVPRRVIILGPNHTGTGAQISVAPHDRWRTPTGDRALDQDLAATLVERQPGAEFDAGAHSREHSIEVQLPFLYARQPDLKFVPVCLGRLDLGTCLELGSVLAKIIRVSGSPVGLIASSDMSHYLPDDEARDLDRQAIDAALTLNPSQLYETVRRENITMCGVVPATVVLAAASELGATQAHLVAYTTSGDVNGDRSAVVGYAGICIHH